MSTHGLVTVVVPIRNEARSIDATLAGLVSQSYTDMEILVVDGESEDGTLDRLSHWVDADPRIHVLPNPGRTASAALNVGLAAALGDWLIRVDGHVEIPSDYVERIVGHLATGRWGGVGGRKDAVGQGSTAEAISAVLGSKFGVGGSLYHYATEPTEVDHIPFGAYPVEIARKLDGWDERLVANQDFEFDARVRAEGLKLLVDPAIVAAWQCRERIIDFARQYRRYGRGKADVARLHPSTLKLRHLAPPALVAALVTTLAATPWTPVPLMVVIVTYALAIAVASAAIARSVRTRSGRLRVPLVLVTMHLSWGLGFWLGLGRLLLHGFRVPDLRGSETVRWGSPAWRIHRGRSDGDGVTDDR